MGHRLKQNKVVNSRTDFFYYAFRNILLFGVPLLVISGLVLSHLSSQSSATSSGTDRIEFSLSVSCTLSSTVDNEHSTNITNGTYVSDIGKTTVTTLCNDGNGYAVYANGYSNDEEGNNKLINSSSPQNSIDTGLAMSGLTSAWAMRLDNVLDDPTPPTITNDYNATYGLIPTYYTKVAEKASGTTDMSQGSSFTTTYAIYASSSQYTGTYVGQVKYMLTHPSYKPVVYYMQEVDSWKNNLAMEESVQAIDKRDGKSYWVTKLKDGNIWMTQNLDLEIGGANTQALTSENTDISTTASGSGIYSNGYTENNGVWTWTPASTAVTSNTKITYPNNTSNPTVSPAWPTNNYTTPYSAEGGDTYYYTSNTTGNDTRYTSLQACKDASHTEDECKRYFAGNYYNWPAAIASNDSTNISSNNTQATNSICPKGWRLPYASTTDNSYNEFGRLLYNSAYNITNNIAGSGNVNYKTGGFNAIRTSPLWFVRSGVIYGGTLYDTGINGNYWSSTVGSSTGAYLLYFNGTDIYPARNLSRCSGWSIRCIAR